MRVQTRTYVSVGLARWPGRMLFIAAVLAASPLACLAEAAASEGLILYVAPDGQPTWSGRLPQPNGDRTDGPLPSIPAARDRLRTLRSEASARQQPATVQVRAGTYFLDAPIEFGPADSGSKEAPVTYAAYPGEQPTISAGRTITNWQVTEENGRTVWAARLPEVQSGQWTFRQLFVNGQSRLRARLPKDGFYRFAGIPGLDPKKTKWNKGTPEANFAPGDLHNWDNVQDVEIVALHFWIEEHLAIAQIDEQANTVKFTTSPRSRLTEGFDVKEGARYYVENVRAALETPGQWCLVSSTGTLYYLPQPGETPQNVTVIAPRLDQLVRVTGNPKESQPVVGLRFEGLTFAHAGGSLPNETIGSAQAAQKVPGALFLTHAQSCAITNCTVSNVSIYAIEFADGCQDNRVVNCTLTELGAGGVKIGPGTSHTTVHNNRIGPGGHIFHSAVGVWIGNSPDNLVTHNHIHHLYYTGVSVGWTWGYRESQAVRNLIEYNHIHDIGQGLLSDMGGVYTLGVSPGTRVCHNLIHDVAAYKYGGWGIYNDEGSTDILIENNVVYRTTHGGYHQHYGKENTIRNNIFAFGRQAQLVRSREEKHLSFTLEHNIVYFTQGELFGSKWTNGQYKLDYNLYYRQPPDPADAQHFKEWQAQGNDLHSIWADPLFVDPARGDFSLKPQSPALSIGFKPIDTTQVGPINTP